MTAIQLEVQQFDSQHGNARVFDVNVVSAYLETLKWRVNANPPALVLFEFCMIRFTGNDLADKRVQSYEVVNNWMELWVASKHDQLFDVGLVNCPEHGRE